MSTVASIALLTPIVASNAVFSVRRASRGIDAIGENPFYAAANMDIAAAQVVKGSKAASSIVSVADPSLEAMTKTASQSIKAASKNNKLLSGAAKVVNFTADHINPVICVGSTIKVLGAEDKVNEAASETIRLGTMFGVENLASKFIGMPVTKTFKGKSVVLKRDGLYKKLLNEKQLNKLNNYCKTNNYMKYLPSIGKGLFFVGASIAGYNIGDKIAKVILGNNEEQTALVCA